MVCGDSLPDLFAIAGQKMYFCNSNFSFMENYIKKAADAFLVERPYGMRVDYRKKGFVLFNRNLNVLGNAEQTRLEELPLERFNVEEIPLVQLKGDDQVWDYLEKLNTNMSQYTKSGSAAPNAVAIGEAAIALTFSHDALQLTPEGYHIELSFPTDGTGYEVGAMALIKGGKADEQENAKKFIDWMTSEAGQGCYAENDSFRVPTNTAAPVADGLVTLDEVPVIDYDAVWAASVKSEYCEQFENKIATKPEG